MSRTIQAAAAACVAAGIASAQVGTPETSPTTPAGAAEVPAGGAGEPIPVGKLLAQADALPPQQRLGVRAALLQRAARVVPDVVIVSDAASYLAAVSAWEGPTRFPVLWDDGSMRSREDIARFVRAFGARAVVRWSVGEGAGVPGWPADRAGREAALREAHARALGIEGADRSEAEVYRQMRAAGVAPPGVVVADAEDPAWTAGLALAAARVQPLVLMDLPGNVDGQLAPDQAETLAAEIAEACRGTGFSFDRLGDDIDALSVCGAVPVKIRVPDGADGKAEFRATTDRLGRAEGENGARWAWAGQIFGTESQAAYRAMCALFLGMQDAWVFDGYPDEPAWKSFDGTEAAAFFRRAGWATTLYDTPRQGINQWRPAAARGLDASLLLVNTKGNADFFDLSPGRAAPGDAPLLLRPAAVHFVHSFSAQRPGDAATVGGAIVARGAYAYVGSVHEPYLAAFVPTPALAERLLSGAAWGAAVRVDPRPVWKVAVFGDPLLTAGEAPPRVEDALPLEGAEDLDAQRVEAVKARDFARAVELLTLLGKDEDAGRLAAAVWKDRPEAFTRELAAVAMPALVRTGRVREAVSAFERLDSERRSEPVLLDLLWDAARVRLLTERNADLVALLRQNRRATQPGEDAIEAAGYLAQTSGAGAAAAYLESVRDAEKNTRVRQNIDQAIARYKRAP
jgi:hypothetical protein